MGALWAAAEDLADWENVVVGLSPDARDFFNHLRDEQRFAEQLGWPLDQDDLLG
ncbi:hypothetical protein [Nonomuraea wenchangensis]|uniref:hypothetical protein n=1 Tax=Nonomuraea wenchangensis TaxID=568860 RepID=UPI0033E21267